MCSSDLGHAERLGVVADLGQRAGTELDLRRLDGERVVAARAGLEIGVEGHGGCFPDVSNCRPS